MDKEVLNKRIIGFEAACDAAEKHEAEASWWIIESAYVTIPTRRLRELLALARIGLEHAE